VIPISKQIGFLICPKENCNQAGFLVKGSSKNNVQIPKQENIKTIADAFDLNAKYFYRIYENLTFAQNSYDSIDHDKLYNPPPYVIPAYFYNDKIVIDTFEKKMKPILENKYELYNKNLKYTNNHNKTLDVNYTKNNLYKREREIFKEKKKTVSKVAIHCLFYSISFAALRDTWKLIREEYSGIFDNCDSHYSDLIKNDDERLVKSICTIYNITKSDFDNRNFFGYSELSKLIGERKTYGSHIASAKNDYRLPFCSKCLNKDRTITTSDRCPVCGNDKRKRVKINPKQIDKYYVDGVNNMLFAITFLPIFIPFMMFIVNMMNIPVCKNSYLSNFKKYEDQVINSGYSYLKSSRYYIRHSGKKEPKRQNCSLKLLDILNIIIKDSLYELWIEIIISNSIVPDFGNYQNTTLQYIHSEYNYPKELILLKILIDVDKRTGYKILTRNFRLYT
jgi:hypothetical protein